MQRREKLITIDVISVLPGNIGSIMFMLFGNK